MYKHGAASSVLSYIVQTLKTRARCMQNMQYKGNKTNLVFMLFDALNAFFSIQTEKDRLHIMSVFFATHVCWFDLFAWRKAWA